MAPKYISVCCVWYCGCCKQDSQTDLLGDLGSHWYNTVYYFWVINTTKNTIESSVLGSYKHIFISYWNEARSQHICIWKL
jgi:hypothetical protein